MQMYKESTELEVAVLEHRLTGPQAIFRITLAMYLFKARGLRNLTVHLTEYKNQRY